MPGTAGEECMLAMAGFPLGRSPRELSRRRLIAEGIAGVASVYAATRLDWSQVFEAADFLDRPPDEFCRDGRIVFWSCPSMWWKLACS